MKEGVPYKESLYAQLASLKGIDKEEEQNRQLLQKTSLKSEINT